MEDVASTVRKSAFQLLCDLIRNNPFGLKIIELEKEAIVRECEKEEETLKKLVDENDKLVEELDELVVNAGTQANGKSTRKSSKRRSLSTTSEESGGQQQDQEMAEEEDEEASEQADNDEEMNRTVVAAQKGGDLELEVKKQKNQELILVQKSKINYLKDTLVFISEIDAAIPKLCKMLFSKTQTDVLEVKNLIF